VKPNVIALSLLAILLSVAAGLGVAGVREAVDTTIADADQLAGQIGVPVLARIPEMRIARARRLGRFQPLLGRRLRRQFF
jgi:capsular polysaccharide biosynthesis protein